MRGIPGDCTPWSTLGVGYGTQILDDEFGNLFGIRIMSVITLVGDSYGATSFTTHSTLTRCRVTVGVMAHKKLYLT